MLEFRDGYVSAEPDQEDVFLVEVNSRPWGSLALARHAGIPFVAEWLALRSFKAGVIQHKRDGISGLQKSTSNVISTSLWPGEIQHLLSVTQAFHAREISFRAFISYFRKSLACLCHPKTRSDFFSRDDWGPAVFQFVSLLLHIGNFTSGKISKLFRPCNSDPKKELLRFKKRLQKISAKQKRHMLVVCQGNRCRSPFIELLLKQHMENDIYEVFSRGLSVRERSVPLRFHSIFSDFGLNPQTHAALPLTTDDLQLADVVFTMNPSQKRQISSHFGAHFREKCIDVSVFGRSSGGVDDPYLLSPWEARRVFDSLNHICEKILNTMKEALQEA